MDDLKYLADILSDVSDVTRIYAEAVQLVTGYIKKIYCSSLEDLQQSTETPTQSILPFKVLIKADENYQMMI